MRFTSVIAALAIVVVSGSTVRAFPPTGENVAGVRCDRMEGNVYHIHAHLAVFDHGKPIGIPEDVGRPLLARCMYWLHTHTPDGIVHVESPVVRTFRLGQFFAIWAVPLTKTDVAGAKLRPGEKLTVWLNGARYSGDPKRIELAQHSDITLDVGAPAPKPAPFTAWGGN